ncbi:MAG: 50S ribosomal protein L17 [Candidatus Ryanbacteria bacterium CG10_big_fil_rev_8_21_14_0_10_43_42]|uniref:50S ribosomal protein L17 n=1 Tax=Candidatus Ryanbacteria bacterium CG10_big_fil_rev_8_21_14_0_10_43_42 TaxID=1974864 RepID=A0A2M8KX14_9BACT|nr:MAG: 50S ribosomal protein L17 [Candidatus Ryanbacteria bacterium CG10_big_fil_rev_8_21_14_0_10_43_42]
MSYTVQGKKLKRNRNQRRALLKSLAANLITHKKIKTTLSKAKNVRPFVERLISIARKDTVASRRYVARYLPKEVVKTLTELVPEYKERPGGYTRITKAGLRKHDASKIAFIEFVK